MPQPISAPTMPPVAAPAPAPAIADAGAFGGLGTELGLAAVGAAAEVALARLVGHDDVDVVARVAAVGDRLVSALGAVAIAEKPGQHRIIGGHLHAPEGCRNQGTRMAHEAPASKRQQSLPAVVWAASQASARSYTSGATKTISGARPRA